MISSASGNPVTGSLCNKINIQGFFSLTSKRLSYSFQRLQVNLGFKIQFLKPFFILIDA